MIKGKVYFVYVGAFCEAYNNYIWDYTTVYTDTVSPSFTDITLDYNYQGNFVNDARVIIVDDIDFMATGYKLDLTDTTDIVIKALTGTLSNCIIHVSGDPLFSSFDTYYNTAEIESDSTIYILIEGSIKISDYVVNIRKKSLHNSFKEVTLDYFETGNILYNDAFINIEGEESFGSAYKFTLQQPEEVYIIFNSKDLENSSLVIYEDSTLQVPVTKTNGIYNLSDTTYYAAFSSNNQLGTYELAIRKYGEITYTDIQLNYNSVEVIDMHSDHININGNLLPAKAFRLTVTDTTYFITDILSSGVGSYDLMSFKDSLFREPIQTSNNLYYTDSVCYFLLIGDAYDSVEIAIMKVYSYHEFPYQERISINVPKTGTIDFSDSLACINNRVNLARSFTVGLVKDKVYKFKLTTMVSSDTRLFNCLSLLIPDTLQGSYNIINGDIITETYDSDNNTSLLKIELSYKADSTADYKLLMQTFASIIPIDYTILVTEFEEPISFDSLLRTAQVINYNVDLPYLEIGNFNETSQFVISDTVFRGSRDKEVFAAKAYAITLEAGDSVICDFGGAFDSYLGLYTRNAQGDCIRIIEEDDTYDTNNNSREQIRYHANSNAVYYFVITTYSELELGGWSLQILKSMADFDDFEIEYKVNLIASETEIYFSKAFTETDVKAELAKLKLYAVNSTDTIGEVINNPGLWTEIGRAACRESGLAIRDRLWVAVYVKQ